MQGVWWDDSSLLMLPHMDGAAVQALAARRLDALPQLLLESRQHPQRAQKLLEQVLGNAKRAQECQQVTESKKPAVHSATPVEQAPPAADSFFLPLARVYRQLRCRRAGAVSAAAHRHPGLA